MAILKINDRVRLISDVDLFPMGIFPAGVTGRVTSNDGYIAMVTLDRYFPSLKEWDNALQVGVGPDDPHDFPCSSDDLEVIGED